jgi:hypothetical protein
VLQPGDEQEEQDYKERKARNGYGAPTTTTDRCAVTVVAGSGGDDEGFHHQGAVGVPHRDLDLGKRTVRGSRA